MFLLYIHIYIYIHIHYIYIYIYIYICDKKCFLDLRPTVQQTNITPKNVGPKAMYSFRFSTLSTHF